jgi:hypothetical protein
MWVPWCLIGGYQGLAACSGNRIPAITTICRHHRLVGPALVFGVFMLHVADEAVQVVQAVSGGE